MIEDVLVIYGLILETENKSRSSGKMRGGDELISLDFKSN